MMNVFITLLPLLLSLGTPSIASVARTIYESCPNVSLPDLTYCSPYDCPHKFRFHELEPSTGSNRQPYFRFMILFKLNPSLCEEQAHEHWKTVHADLTMAAENTGVDVVRYVQFHMDKEHRDALQPLVATGSVVCARSATCLFSVWTLIYPRFLLLMMASQSFMPMMLCR